MRSELRIGTRFQVGVAIAVLGLLTGQTGQALAHEHRKVGGMEMTVGWVDEPTFAGFKNAAQVILTGADGKPITDLGDTLTVEIIFGEQKMAAVPVRRAFGKTAGRPGVYHAEIIPTRPGNYTFHFVGTVHDQKIDESFTTSEKTFDPVQDPSAIQFPAKDPSAAELAGLVQRVTPRVDAAQAASRDAAGGAAQARTIGLLGVVLGTVGIAVGLAAGRRRRGP